VTWWLVYTIAASIWVAISAVIIVLQRRPAASTIAWLLVLVFLPIVGLLVYRLIGPLRLERKKRRRELSRRIVEEGLRGLAALDSDSEHHQLAMVSIGVGGSPPLRAESIEIFIDGASTYAAILDAVASARDHIHLEYYIWEPDTIGTRLRDVLVERAKAGVKIRMLVDGTGSNKLSKKFLRPLVAAGVAVSWFNPVRLRTLRRRRADFRTHRKIVVVDGRIGFTGGMNITDLHSAELSKQYWRDTHLRLTGPAVWPIQRTFFEDWAFAADELLPTTEQTVPPPHHESSELVQVVASGPDTSSWSIHKVFFTAINQSTKRLWITSPYFIPDDALFTALVTASLRGVDVRLLVPKKGDSRLVDLAARSYFPELLEAGVKVYEYEPRFIHAKTMVCDDDVGVVGTANFDYRSFRLNFEIIAVLFGRAGNTRLADAFTTDLADSREVKLVDLEALPFTTRLGQASARLLSPLL
jgi:cardiolipin synthase